MKLESPILKFRKNFFLFFCEHTEFTKSKWAQYFTCLILDAPLQAFYLLLTNDCECVRFVLYFLVLRL